MSRRIDRRSLTLERRRHSRFPRRVSEFKFKLAVCSVRSLAGIFLFRSAFNCQLGHGMLGELWKQKIRVVSSSFFRETIRRRWPHRRLLD